MVVSLQRVADDLRRASLEIAAYREESRLLRAQLACIQQEEKVKSLRFSLFAVLNRETALRVLDFLDLEEREDVAMSSIGLNRTVMIGRGVNRWQETLYIASPSEEEEGTMVVEAHDVPSGRWEQLPPTDWLKGETSLCFHDGVLYLVGGRKPSAPGHNPLSDAMPQPTRRVAAYDPRRHVWNSTGSMLHARCGHATASGLGRVWAIGGQGRSGMALSSVEQYHPERGSWELLSDPVPTARIGAAVVCLRGVLYVIGGTVPGGFPNQGEPGPEELHGMGASTRACSLVEAYDLNQPRGARAWASLNPMQLPRDGCSAVALTDRTILVVGGAHVTGEVFDTQMERWDRIRDFNIPRSHPSCVMGHGDVYILGGGMTSIIQATQVELYNANQALLESPRSEHKALAALNLRAKVEALESMAEDPDGSHVEVERLLPSGMWRLARAGFGRRRFGTCDAAT